MTRGLAIGGWMAVVAVAAAGTGLSARAAARAARSAGTEIRTFNDLAEQCRTLARLRATKPVWGESSAAEPGLASGVSAVLSSCGLPASVLSAFSPESDRAGAGPLKVERQRATLTLTPVTLPQLGAFLDAWRRRQPAWVCTSIEVAPEAARSQVSPGADLPLRAVVTIETFRLRSGGER